MTSFYRKLIFIFVINVFVFNPLTALSIDEIKKPSIVFLSPDFEDTHFFKTVIAIMQSAANSLDVSLEVVYGNDNPGTILDIGKSVLNRAERPDYLVMVNDLTAIPRLMEIAQQKGQKTFLFNAAYKPGVYDKFKSTSSTKATWFGSLIPDDEQAGYLLAKELVEQARRKGLKDKEGKINIIGVNGSHRSLVPVRRETGLRQFVIQNEDVDVKHVVSAYWGKERAQDVVEKLLLLFPETTLIWSASDLMSVGAALGAEQKQRKVGKDILTCGIDWLPVSFEQIKQDRLSCSIGGHIFDGAWLIVLLHDQFNNLYPDFINEKTHYSTVTKANLSDVENIFKNQLWKNIDFKKFSKAYNQSLSIKEFGSHLLISELY